MQKRYKALKQAKDYWIVVDQRTNHQVSGPSNKSTALANAKFANKALLRQSMPNWTDHLTQAERDRLDQIEADRAKLSAERMTIYQRAKKRRYRLIEQS